MLLLCLACRVFALRDSLPEIEVELLDVLTRIEDGLATVRAAEHRLRSPTELTQFQLPAKTSANIDLTLVSVDSSRTQEGANAKMPRLFASESPVGRESDTAFAAKQSAPVFVFKPDSIAVARTVIVDHPTAAACSVRMFRLHFYCGGQLVFVSRPIDLPKEETRTAADLEVDVIFDSVHFDTLYNWGNAEQTCLASFELRGPKFDN
jgi:hypothetical protein